MNKILFLIFFVILCFLNVVNFGGRIVFSQNTTPVVMMNERIFSIPFQVLNNNSYDRTDEVELIVSKDRGTHWYSVGRKPIEAKFFVFETDSDGEYWFAFRTITASGSVKRSAINSPQIRVLVNTSNLTATQKTNSQLQNYNTPNTANSKSHKITEGTIQPPKPIVFNKNPENIPDKKIIKNKTEQANSTSNNQKNHKNQEKQLVNLPPLVSPKNKLLNINNDNIEETKSHITGTIELPDKLSKTERRAKLLLSLFDNVAALFKNEIYDKNDVDKNTGNKKVIAKKIDKNDVGNTNISNDIMPVNNHNEKDNVAIKDGPPRELGIVAKSIDSPSAVMATAAETVAKNYQQVRNTNQNQNQEQNTTRDIVKLRITGVTMNVATEQYQIIVKWNSGDSAVSGKLVDVLRGESENGLWQPIAIGLPNNGEYWWYVSPEDKKPFYIKIRTRNSVEVICEDTTKSPITIK
ncbi:MAG: hypothetical protein LBC74_09045 [Planctomycetaceae bacterium]|jgi:hypothetical protein|nr:hypothetical protein [Planctomycetaceae bacterium]